MSIKRYLLPTITILVILGLLYAAAWQDAHPRWHGMPESLTKPDPNIDRSHMPLGPYTADFSGLIGGPTGERRVAYYVVISLGDVHLQHVGEVGKRLDGAAVLHVGVQYLANRVPAQLMPKSGPMVDGLRLHEGTLHTRPEFHIPGFGDATGQPIQIICSLFPEGLRLLEETHSFQGVRQGMCTAMFRPRPHLHVSMGGIQPKMMSHMSLFVPKVYRLVSEHIQGEQ